MNNLQAYIRESIFGTSAEEKVQKSYEDLLRDQLKKYTYDQLRDYERSESPWENGSIRWTSKGFDIRCSDIGYICLNHITGLKKLPDLKIHYVNGTVFIQDNNIETLEGIFTDDAKVDGGVHITNNPKLVSLKGCPEYCWIFECKMNRKLPWTEVEHATLRGLVEFKWKSNSPIPKKEFPTPHAFADYISNLIHEKNLDRSSRVIINKIKY